MEESNLTAPGVTLRKARLAKGLSEADIASRLRLPLHLVKALEADEYADFAALVYVRGYIRGYAVLLDLDSASLLAAFDQLNLESAIDQTHHVQSVSSSMTQIGYLHQSKRRFARWMGWIIALFLIVLLGTWWYGQHHRKHIDMSAGLLLPTSHVVTLTVPVKPAVAALSAVPAASAPVAPAATAPVATSAVTTPAVKLAPAAATTTKVSGLHETFILLPKKA